jgi:hypothetical protein
MSSESFSTLSLEVRNRYECDKADLQAYKDILNGRT